MATQRTHIKRWTFGSFGALSVAVLLATGLCCWAVGEIEVAIDVAPNVLNLQNQGELVTVHTDLPYSSVVGASVSLNDVSIAWWKIDNRGYFVAKFDIDAIKGLPLDIGAMNTLSLSGVTQDGVEFYGVTQILVVDNVPAGKK